MYNRNGVHISYMRSNVVEQTFGFVLCVGRLKWTRKLFAVWQLSTLDASYLITAGSWSASHQQCCQSVHCLVQLHKERKPIAFCRFSLHSLWRSSAVTLVLEYAAAVSNSVIYYSCKLTTQCVQQNTDSKKTSFGLCALADPDTTHNFSTGVSVKSRLFHNAVT